jgi:hypothetical protein
VKDHLQKSSSTQRYGPVGWVLADLVDVSDPVLGCTGATELEYQPVVVGMAPVPDGLQQAGRRGRAGCWPL